MKESILREQYAARGCSEEVSSRAVASVAAFEQWLVARGSSLEQADVALVREYIRFLMETGQNQPETLLALARYVHLIGRNNVYLYFTTLLGSEGVFESIQERLALLTKDRARPCRLDALQHPPLGSEPGDFPEFTRQLMERLEAALPEKTVQRVLAGNNHCIPAAAFEDEVQLYRQASSLDEYLSGRHKRQVAKLQQHCDSNTVWFEQMITQRVVDYVAANPEILSAVRAGDTLYVTKIPYQPDAYLASDDPLLKRYYACHCPFVREAILRGEPAISANWCYCSGGFAKHPYEVILGRELHVTLLKSALNGDSVCRFAIHLDEAAE